jgi:RHS repeat-associated protein
LKIAGISSKKLDAVGPESGAIRDGIEGSLKNEYLYNDKELFDEGDLNWLDYGFRNYDPQVGRFVQIDPLTDDYASINGYHYALNDLIGNVDIDGLYVGNIVNGAGNITVNEVSKGVYDVVAKTSIKSVLAKQAAMVAGSNGLKNLLRSATELTGAIINAAIQIYSKGQQLYNTVSLNNDLENARTGTTFGERFVHEELSLENVFGGLASSELKIGKKVVAKALEKYEVGTAENLLSKSLKGDGLDIHHV